LVQGSKEGKLQPTQLVLWREYASQLQTKPKDRKTGIELFLIQMGRLAAKPRQGEGGWEAKTEIAAKKMVGMLMLSCPLWMMLK